MNASAPRVASLAIINPSGQRTRQLIDVEPFLIGRQPDNQLVLRDNRVSRVHARIIRDGDDYEIEDLRSRAGLFVNGVRVQSRARLHNADVVTFGFADGYQLVFTHEEQGLNKLAERVSGSAMEGAGLGRLRALVEVARSLQTSLSVREVLESIVDAALTVTRTERGFVLLKKGGTGELQIEVARDSSGMPLAPTDLRVPTRVIQRALERRRELLSMHFDPLLSDAEQPDQSVAALDLRSVVCVPLIRVRTGDLHTTYVSSPEDTTGLLYLDSRLDLADLSAGNREILQTLALEASTVLENARLLEQERARQRLDDELRIARDLQQSLLPSHLPTTGWFRVVGSSVPTHHVGGDYFDAAPAAGGDWWTMVVADVSGKGIGSALMASLLQGAFLHAPIDEASIRAMLSRINTYLYERTEGEKYATVFYAALHKSGRLLWSNAAHCPPVIISADGTMESLPATSMAVGMLDFTTFVVREKQLSPGTRIVVFSDGYTDAQNPQGETFDQSRITSVLKDSSAYGAERLHASLSAALRRFTAGAAQPDDMTLVVSEYQLES
jgi:serine phosphatase RsbU (regulator of sigma subunit)